VQSVVALAPAKINLALHVTGRRDDGYHEIETLAVFAETGDRIVANAAYADSFGLSGPFAAKLEGHGGNLVLKARDALRQWAQDAGHVAGAVALRLEKNLPVASGIGGGSADGAAALLALKALWELPDDFPLAEIARNLGADVPMCLASRPLLASGIGENITPVELSGQLHALLVNPGVAVPTQTVFGLLRQRENPPLQPLPTHGFDIGWLARQRNDLEQPAIAAHPVIGKVLARLEACKGALLARMSGSGATCFALFGTAQEAQAAADAIARVHPGWWCVATRLLPGEYSGRVKVEA
jgi:4-diphosphocytidyl-2-C-methyl-D-erythritol kinase